MLAVFFLATFLHPSVAILFNTGFKETRSLPLFTVNYFSVLSNLNLRSSCYCRKWMLVEGRLPQVKIPLDVTRHHFHKACSWPSFTTFGFSSWRLSFYILSHLSPIKQQSLSWVEMSEPSATRMKMLDYEDCIERSSVGRKMLVVAFSKYLAS